MNKRLGSNRGEFYVIKIPTEIPSLNGKRIIFRKTNKTTGFHQHFYTIFHFSLHANTLHGVCGWFSATDFGLKLIKCHGARFLALNCCIFQLKIWNEDKLRFGFNATDPIISARAHCVIVVNAPKHFAHQIVVNEHFAQQNTNGKKWPSCAREVVNQAIR